MGGFVYNAIDQTEVATAEIYGKALADIILKDPKVVAITADLAKSTKLGDVLKVCPERVINVGIAEQDMFGVAAGMAKAGCIPFLSGFSAFTSMRACDQLHTDICYQNVNAKIIATHAGTSFGQAGSTHHAITDLAITRAMPRTAGEKAMQRALLQCGDPKNADTVRKALHICHREDLIGFSDKCLVKPAYKDRVQNTKQNGKAPRQNTRRGKTTVKKGNKK